MLRVQHLIIFFIVINATNNRHLMLCIICTKPEHYAYKPTSHPRKRLCILKMFCDIKAQAIKFSIKLYSVRRKWLNGNLFSYERVCPSKQNISPISRERAFEIINSPERQET